ncbi:MAG: hypothetical protein JWL76_723 [Thermoleophilia bacterium]|nr:hypothetical protein [Thermoleophilia bacterium]
MSDLRVLMPYRLDYFARSMDTTLATMWLAMRECCDMVFWGPGFPGYDPAQTIDDAVRTHAPHVVLLPDLHHATPGLWDDLLVGIDRVTCPTALFLSDPLSALDERRQHLQRLHPTAVLGLGAEAGYDAYADLLAELDCELLVRPLGHDPALFYAPEAGTERDIDVLICGAANGPAYPVRTRIKQAAAMLAPEWNVVDVCHPGYWECVSTSPVRRGQPAFADLLRRSRLVVTGTTYEILSAKYYEVAACGAVGVGDLPAQVGADDLRDAMLEIDPNDDAATIAAAMRTLLEDPARLDAMGMRAEAAARATDVVARARYTVELLAGLLARHGHAAATPPDAAPRTRQQLVDPLRVCVRVDPAAPAVRRDWHVLAGAPHEQVDDLRALLRGGSHEQCVLAFDPDAAVSADALLLAELARSTDAIAIRPAAPGATPLEQGFCCVAVDRLRLLDALDSTRGVAAIEAAIWTLLDTHPAVTLAHPGFDTPAVHARRSCGAVDAGIAGADEPSEPLLHHRRIPGARFARLDPSDPGSIEHATELLRAGFTAAPLELGVPVRCGLTLDDAGAELERHLASIGLDVDACSDVVVLERPLSDAELAWLESDARIHERSAA